MKTNKRKTKELLNKRDVTILLNSSVINSYDYLKFELCSLRKFKSYTDNELSEADEKVKKLFENGMINTVLKIAKEEWKSDFNSETKNDYMCQLCGKKHIDYVFKIYNKMNENVLEVGSECIKKYTEIKTVNGASTEELINEVKKTKIKEKNLRNIESAIPNVYEIIDVFETNLTSSAYMLPIYLENKMKEINSEYKNGKILETKNSNTSSLLHIINDIDLYNKEYQEYITQVEKNEFGINKRISKWIRENVNNYDDIKSIKTIGVISIDNIHLIKEHDLSYRLIKKARTTIEESGFIMIETRRNNLLFKYIKNDAYLFKPNLHGMVMLCKKNIFKNEKISINPNRVFDLLSPTIKTYELIGHDLLDKIGLKNIITDYDKDSITYSINGKYYSLDLLKTVDQFKNSMMDKSLNVNELISYISKNATELEKY